MKLYFPRSFCGDFEAGNLSGRFRADVAFIFHLTAGDRVRKRTHCVALMMEFFLSSKYFLSPYSPHDVEYFFVKKKPFVYKNFCVRRKAINSLSYLAFMEQLFLFVQP